MTRIKWTVVLPIVLMVVFALTRWPGAMPLNFSAAYGLAFCAGVYFSKRLAWVLPLATLVVSDLALNIYYWLTLHINAFQPYQFFNYLAYAVIIGLGQRMGSRASWLKLVIGGVVGALVFYVTTNTAAWFFNPFRNPEYTRTLNGWIIALTRGTAGYPETWMFFRNTLLSGGLFTGLFAGTMKLSEHLATEEDEEETEAAEASPEESKA
jgi:hypothetical protein